MGRNLRLRHSALSSLRHMVLYIRILFVVGHVQSLNSFPITYHS